MATSDNDKNKPAKRDGSRLIATGFATPEFIAAHPQATPGPVTKPNTPPNANPLTPGPDKSTDVGAVRPNLPAPVSGPNSSTDLGVPGYAAPTSGMNLKNPQPLGNPNQDDEDQLLGTIGNSLLPPSRLFSLY